MEIVIASRNRGKVREIREIFSDLPVTFRDLEEFGSMGEIEETGSTFSENARIKAVKVSRVTGMHALADDSGIEVDALEGRPGIHSARYSDPGGTDEKNNLKLLDELRDVSDSERTARYRCVVVLAYMGKVAAEADGTFEGRILTAPRGDGGFGYDPLFLVPDLGLSAAELSSEEKHRLSHRGMALRKLHSKVTDLLGRRST